jgi:D-tyrosyl-tRNA(Tyr) deacylase
LFVSCFFVNKNTETPAVRIVIQRVSEARVCVAGEVVAQIGRGMCLLFGVSIGDEESRANLLADKIKNLRIFDDAQGKLNRSITDIGGEILVVSQFTLYGDVRKGNRPSFTSAAEPNRANALYEHFVERLRLAGLRVGTGRFGARMQVHLVNDGPVTLILES